ncbi:hypothetical protein IAQ61_006396 [Plenodomus lingam]|uniref:uncharacterized protein n=1 Tax=Leptosphaeria maculans TaxID=5022 RepID=UPI0033258DC6|nr:hypothetical protein IAQ61_006396 [Plenodomus lingam]
MVGAHANGHVAPRAFTTYTTRSGFDGAETSPLLRNREPRKPTLGHRRKHSPNLEWREKWTPESWKSGRVLLIDYVDKAHSPEGKMKVVAQEFCDIDSLRRFYGKEDLSAQAALRVIHVQNARWATRFLLRKYNIDANDDLVGTTFGRWAGYDKPQQRGGKPVLNGRTFRAQRDPWRGISRTAFGIDYLKQYPRGTVRDEALNQKPIMELNHYNEDDQPAHGFDVYVQRLSVYVQLSDGKSGQAVDPDIPNPYNEEAYEEYQRLKRHYGNVDANEHREMFVPQLRTLDNGNTIILFEGSVSGSVKDTLIGARQELESRWRRLTFYLPREEIDNDDSVAIQCMDFVLKDVFKAIAYNWDKFVAVCETHVSILEDKIYENPADESRAPELWKNSAQWLKVERLIYIHVDVSQETRGYLHELFGSDPHDDTPWLGNAPDDLDKLTGQWERDIVGPTTALSDLMYKSVGIRDARHSLQLGLSMWRLSWITFIFLPLTFTVGFFGMNVDVFAANPQIKWWFITSVPVLLTVLVLWYAVKHSLSRQRQNPLRRGVYEALYYEFATEHAELWTRGGPREDVVPVGWANALRWRLLTTWFGGDKLRLVRRTDPATEEFGTWSRVKRYLAKRWLDELVIMPQGSPLLPPGSGGKGGSGGGGSGSSGADKDTEPLDFIPFKELRMQQSRHRLGAVGDLLSIATPVAIAELDPTAASRMAGGSNGDSNGGGGDSGSGAGAESGSKGGSGSNDAVAHIKPNGNTAITRPRPPRDHRSLGPAPGQKRPGSSAGSSEGGVMVEEKGVSEDEGRGGGLGGTGDEGRGRG